MARTAEAARLTEAHRQAQLQVRARAVRDFARLWPLWTGDERSFQRLLEASLPLIRAHHGASSTLAAGYYETFRRAERVEGAATPRLAEPLVEGVVLGTLHVTGAELTRRALLAGQSPEAAMRTALVRTSGTVSRFTLAGGRDTLIQSAAADRRAGGWARVTAASACAFCAMLASRGAVYSEDTADFRAHDHCSCTVEVRYAGSALPPSAQRWRDLYDQAQREGGAAGTANDALNNLRRLMSRA